jgi:exopolysaccharide biosynthesis polyprenyl glycosylphosphotransferase
MSADPSALLQGLEFYDEMNASVGERTRDIVERRRRTAVVRRRGWLVRRLLLAADLVGLIAAFMLSEFIGASYGHHGLLDAHAEMIAFFASLPLWILVAKLYGLYARDEEHTDHSTGDELSGVFHMVTLCTWGLVAGSYVTGLAHPTMGKLLLFWASAVGFVSVGRGVARTIARRSPVYLQNAVIVGAGDVGQLIAQKLLQHPEYGINVVGLIGTPRGKLAPSVETVTLLGGPERLPAIIRLFDIERVIVAFSNFSDKETAEIVRGLMELDIQIDVVPRLYELFSPNAGLHMIEGLPLVGMPPIRLSSSSKLLKRVLDLLVAGSALLVLAPLFALIALAVKLDSPGPVLYRHRRVGLGGGQIDVLKFRTMRIEACRGDRYGGESAEAEFAQLMTDPAQATAFATSYKLENDPRVTRLGHLLRRLSLDELPQLLNVLRGDLSIVGPRPVTTDELSRYGDSARSLTSIRPGVTGYWQINGRSQLRYEDRVRLDLSYIRGWSLGLDMRILVSTVRVLLARRGAA